MKSKHRNKTSLAFLLALSAFSGIHAQDRVSLSLQQCRDLALSNSEELQQSDLKLQQSRLDRQIARTAYFPKLEASATGAYVFPDMDIMGMDLRMRGMYMAGFTLTQPLSDKSFLIASIALCSFGNFGSIAIQMGGIGEMAPNQRKNLARLGVRALICGTLTCYMSAAIAGILMG